MPTYLCSFPPGRLDEAQKDAVARAITRLHSEATGAPPFFVQVVIADAPGTRRYLGGAPADDHVWIRADIRAGRPDNVREALMLAIMRAVAGIAGIEESSVWVYLCNLAPTDMVEYGHVLPAPGEEQAWFDALPADLRERLARLGTDRTEFCL